MSDTGYIVLAAFAVVLLFMIGRSIGARHDARKAAAEEGAAASAPATADAQLVAVIAAAVSAASGMAAGSFRVVGISPSGQGGAGSGFNTPVWGHIERFTRGE